MTSCKTSTYVGFGFGAIQGGLFLLEASKSGAFDRLVVAEVVPETIRALQDSGGHYAVNVAHADALEVVQVGPVEMLDPAIESDRDALIDALAEAREIGTALPSVAFYTSSSPGSVHRLLAAGLRRKAAKGGPPAVVYAAENNNHAASILEEQVMAEIPLPEQEAVRARVRFLDTVIGKMSGVVSNPEQIKAQGLSSIAPKYPRAFLVEAFNHILVSKPDFGSGTSFSRGIDVFQEKTDLMPFEEAKLYGHNATHALAAYIGGMIGVSQISELRQMDDVMTFLRRAFIEESGKALCRKHEGIDSLFTAEGYGAYADDLLERMMNPLLGDTVERVGRDPERKLGWDDRLTGTMRIALSQGIQPRCYALGAAAALARMKPSLLHTCSPVDDVLMPLWEHELPEAEECAMVIQCVAAAMASLRQSADIRRALVG
jgi:mannitol-1-phosphate 5-dehydrogenase